MLAIICVRARAEVSSAAFGLHALDARRDRRFLARKHRPRRKDRRRMRSLLQEQRVDENRKDRDRRHHERNEFARMLADHGGEAAGGFECRCVSLREDRLGTFLHL